MGSLMESLHGNLNSQKQGGGSSNSGAGGSSGSGAASGVANTGPISPIPLAFLDSLTVHAKMSLIHRYILYFIIIFSHPKMSL